MYFWKFTIHGYTVDTGKFTHKGLIYGNNFTEAVDNLENYYCDDICTLFIEPVGEEGQPYFLNTQYEINEG